MKILEKFNTKKWSTVYFEMTMAMMERMEEYQLQIGNNNLKWESYIQKPKAAQDIEFEFRTELDLI